MADAPPLTGREKILRFGRNGLAGLILVLATAYLLDYAVLRYRMAADKEPFGTVTVRPIYLVPQKDHKTEFLVGDPLDQQCVHSLFPHHGDAPCWYLRSHREQQIKM